MKIFQAATFYQPYLESFNQRFPELRSCSFASRVNMLLRDRFMDLHILKPVLEGCHTAGFSVPNDPLLMRAWAKEHGLANRSLMEILLAQIEESGSDVFYTLHPKVFNHDFIRRLPGCVKTKVAWLAAPDDGLDFSCYDGMLSNFPPLMQAWAESGIRGFDFFPGVDANVIHEISQHEDRPIQISFAGQFSPSLHHKRNAMLVALAREFEDHTISLRLQHRKWKPFLKVRGLQRLNSPIRTLPVALRKVAGPAVYGRGVYELFGASQIVFNGTIDFGIHWRVNMRCFEIALSGACMVGDAGFYSGGFEEGSMFSSYRSEEELSRTIKELLDEPQKPRDMGNAARKMVLERYNKEKQWNRFQEIISQIN